jgi:hypothetical protein
MICGDRHYLCSRVWQHNMWQSEERSHLSVWFLSEKICVWHFRLIPFYLFLIHSLYCFLDPLPAPFYLVLTRILTGWKIINFPETLPFSCIHILEYQIRPSFAISVLTTTHSFYSHLDPPTINFDPPTVLGSIGLVFYCMNVMISPGVNIWRNFHSKRLHWTEPKTMEV